MTDSLPDPTPVSAANWEAFYASYKKPGYVPGFEITSKLGAGMFGLVFKATRQSIGKDYAIKFLKVDDGEVRRAVLQELDQVRYFAQVDHPNLVAIEDKGEVDGIPYIVMSYAGAQTLRDLLPGDASTRGEALNLLLQACRGVAALHERSLVHFDLKPANVFLKGGVARVGDYGLSKLVTHSQRSLSMGRGTPYYMAPEMLHRKGDHRSDVYSIGVMLFEVLCGDVPFKGDSEWAVLKQHETAALAFPSHVPPRERSIVQRCMHKDPDQRFQAVGEMIAAFGAPLGVGAASVHEARMGRTAAKFAPPLPLRPRLEESPPVPPAAPSAAMAPPSQRPFRSEMPTLRKRSRFSSAVVVLGFVVLGMWLLFPVRGGPQMVVSSSSMPEAASSRAIGKHEQAAVARAPRDSDWTRTARRDMERARAQLEAQLKSFRSEAPLDFEQRARGVDLPVFGPLAGVDDDSRNEVQGQLQLLEASPDYDEVVAAELLGHGVIALKLAAASLQGRDLSSSPLPDGVQNLQRFLQEATGAREIRLQDDPTAALALRQTVNTPVPSIWLMWLDRFAPNDEAWATYQRLRRK